VWKRGGRGAKVEIVYSRATGYLGGFLEKRFDHSASVDVCSERLEVIPIRHSRLHSAADMRAWLNARLVDSSYHLIVMFSAHVKLFVIFTSVAWVFNLNLTSFYRV